MSMLFRALSFVGLAVLSVFITPLLAVPAALLYAWRWYAPELLLLGLAIDAYFGPMSEWPYYAIGSFLIVAGTEIAKRYLMIK